MFRVTQGFRPSAVTMLGGLFMGTGALVYLRDSIDKPRNLHTFLFPALGLMALGAIIAFLGATFIDRRRA